MTNVQKHWEIEIEIEIVRTNLCDILKAFVQVRLYSSRIFGLGQNLQELIIWQEVKPTNRYTLY